MKLEDFKKVNENEAVVLHSDNGRKGRKFRRFTTAATVVNNRLFVAKSVCGNLDQFSKKDGVSRALGRLTSALVHFKNHTFSEKTERNGLVQIFDYNKDYNRKEVLQCIDYIK